MARIVKKTKSKAKAAKPKGLVAKAVKQARKVARTAEKEVRRTAKRVVAQAKVAAPKLAPGVFAPGPGFPVDENTRVIVQGITGHQGQFHTEKMLEFGTRIVGGVTPGKGGEKVQGVPVFDACREAVEKTGANASVVYVPAKFTKDAVLEAIDAGIKTVVVITEHIPYHDAMQFVWYAKTKGARVLGPNCPGMANPRAKVKLGILPNKIFKPGVVGVASRSGTLTYEIVNALSEKGVGQSGVLGLGGDPVNGTNFIDALEIFNADPRTEAIVLVGEIGGTAEEEAAAYVAKHVKKPVFAYIAGRSAPEGKRMGHAGAIVSRGMGTAQSKIEAFRKAGVEVAEFPGDIAEMVTRTLKNRK